MAKRKITVTVDEELVTTLQALGVESLSLVVNTALSEEVNRRARSAALGRQLAQWESEFGPLDSTAVAEAAGTFDDLDAVDTRHVAPDDDRGAA